MARPFGSRNRYPRQDRKVVVRRLVDHPAPTPLDTPCRLWQGALTRSGYGRKNRHYMHRWVWEQAHGPIPDGMYVLHRCDQPLCFRYDHLFLGTAADNTHDMEAKNRQRGRFQPNTGARMKLTVEDVREIRRRYQAGEATQSELGRVFGVHRTTILRIVRHESRRAA